MSNSFNLILASSSPRRRELLTELGLDFVARAADIDETPFPDENPEDYVHRLAQAKALEISSNLNADEGAKTICIGSDVTVHYQSEIIGKPENEEDARQMLMKLSGTRHEIVNGYALSRGEQILASGIVTNTIKFREITEAELPNYFAAADWQDKAGGYAVQGEAAKFVEEIDGEMSAIIGMPIVLIAELLNAYGISVDGGNIAELRQKYNDKSKYCLAKNS